MSLKDRATRLSVHRRVHAFTVSDLLGHTMQLGGNGTSKSAFLFFEPSCSHCQLEISRFDSLGQFNSAELKVYAISLGSPEHSHLFAQEQQARDFYIATPHTAAQLGITKVPVLMLVDRDGTIQDIEEGERSTQFQHALLSRFQDNLPINKNDISLSSTR